MFVDVGLLGGEGLVGEGAAVHEARDQVQGDGGQILRHKVACERERGAGCIVEGRVNTELVRESDDDRGVHGLV